MKNRDYSACAATVEEIRTKFPNLKAIAWQEFQLGRALADQGRGDLKKAGPYLEKFLDGGPYAERDCAPEARYHYGQLLARAGRVEEAEALIASVADTGNARVVNHAYRKADSLGLIESEQDAQRWQDGMERAKTAAQTVVDGGEAWVSQAKRPYYQAHRARKLKTAQTAIPHLEQDSSELARSFGAPDSFFTLGHQGQASQRKAHLLSRAGKSQEAKALWEEAERQRAQALAALPPLSPPGSSDPLDPNQLKARVSLGIVRFHLSNEADAKRLLEEVAAYASDPRCADDPLAQHTITDAQVWLIACRQSENSPPAEVVQSLLDLLGNRLTTMEETTWAFQQLAGYAMVGGDTRGEALYLRDLANSLPQRSACVSAKQLLAELYRKDAALEASLGADHSPGYERMAANGKIEAGAEEGRFTFKTLSMKQLAVPSAQ
ncbi:MAG: hypothetical protein NTW86_29905 [Candidatus Sumerlaeota bacterium]|nr:hypothetical protein [Candidatus Sumerlaeota bacterium]